jgi:hypothetical protein
MDKGAVKMSSKVLIIFLAIVLASALIVIATVLLVPRHREKSSEQVGYDSKVTRLNRELVASGPLVASPDDEDGSPPETLSFAELVAQFQANVGGPRVSPELCVRIIFQAYREGRTIQDVSKNVVDFLRPLRPPNDDWRQWVAPSKPRGVRNTHGICYAIAGYQVLATFEPLLRQLVASSPNRDEARVQQVMQTLEQLTNNGTDVLDNLSSIHDQPGWNDAFCLLVSVLDGFDRISNSSTRPTPIPLSPELHRLRSLAMDVEIHDVVHLDIRGPKSEAFAVDDHYYAIGPLLLVLPTGLSPELGLNSTKHGMQRVKRLLNPHGPPATFELKAVVDSSSHHATAYVQRYDAASQAFRWYDCNDSMVTELPACSYLDGTPLNERPPCSVHLRGRPQLLCYLQVDQFDVPLDCL